MYMRLLKPLSEIFLKEKAEETLISLSEFNHYESV